LFHSLEKLAFELLDLLAKLVFNLKLPNSLEKLQLVEDKSRWENWRGDLTSTISITVTVTVTDYLF
jgi:hypothetical protein